MASAMPWPPPMQSVTIPRLSPSRRMECISFVVKIAPVAPIGWPCATAPPSTDDVFGKSKLPGHDDGDGRERLIDLDTLNRARFPPGTRQRLMHRRDRPKTEHSRLDRRDSVGHKPRLWRKPALLGPACVRKHHGGRSVRKGTELQAVFEDNVHLEMTIWILRQGHSVVREHAETCHRCNLGHRRPRNSRYYVDFTQALMP